MSEGRPVVGPLVYDPERECWRECGRVEPRRRPRGCGARHERTWTEDDWLLVALAALRSKAEPGLARRVREARAFTPAQYSMGRSVALDSLGLPGGFGSAGSVVLRRLVKTLGLDEVERRGRALLARRTR